MARPKFMLLSAVGLAAMLSISPAFAEGHDDPASALNPVTDDDCCITPASPDDVPLEPTVDDVSEIVPGEPDDEPLDPVTDDDVAPVISAALAGPSSDSSASSDDRVGKTALTERAPATTFVVYVPTRPDGSRPDITLQAAKNGRDSEIWVDGTPRAVLRDRLDLTLTDLKIVYP